VQGRAPRIHARLATLHRPRPLPSVAAVKVQLSQAHAGCLNASALHGVFRAQAFVEAIRRWCWGASHSCLSAPAHAATHAVFHLITRREQPLLTTSGCHHQSRTPARLLRHVLTGSSTSGSSCCCWHGSMRTRWRAQQVAVPVLAAVCCVCCALLPQPAHAAAGAAAAGEEAFIGWAGETYIPEGSKPVCVWVGGLGGVCVSVSCARPPCGGRLAPCLASAGPEHPAAPPRCDSRPLQAQQQASRGANGSRSCRGSRARSSTTTS
jgi:hypothetical protein